MDFHVCVQYLFELVFCIMSLHAPSYSFSKSFLICHTQRICVGSLPYRLLYANFMHVTPVQGKAKWRAKEKRIQCIDLLTLRHTLNFVQPLPPPILHSLPEQAFH